MACSVRYKLNQNLQGGVSIKEVKPFIIPVIALILIDQITKLIIMRFFMKFEFDLVGVFLRFKPLQNIKLSYGGNFIDILSNMWVLILLNLLIIFIFISGYLLYKTKRKYTGFSVKIIMICGLAGCMCSLIDKMFWGGSLDFLQILNAFVFDLKDCYLTVAQVLFVIMGILHRKEISFKEYVYFCYHKFRP